jgi:hypothetical protein
VVLLRKSNPQNHNLQTAVEHGVMGFLNYFCRIVESMKEQKQKSKSNVISTLCGF